MLKFFTVRLASVGFSWICTSPQAARMRVSQRDGHQHHHRNSSSSCRVGEPDGDSDAVWSSVFGSIVKLEPQLVESFCPLLST